MLLVVKERLEGPKYNIDFGGGGGGTQGRIGMSTVQKGPLSLIVACTLLNRQSAFRVIPGATLLTSYTVSSLRRIVFLADFPFTRE